MNLSKINEMSGFRKLLTAIACLMMIIIGFFLMFNRLRIVGVFSVAVFIHGVHKIIRYISMKEERSGWDLISGFVNIVFGVLMIFGRVEDRIVGVLAIEIYIAIWAVITGFSETFESFKVRKDGPGSGWGWKLIGGILIIICGIGLFARPMMGAWALINMGAIFASVSFIFIGLTGLGSALSGKKT